MTILLLSTHDAREIDVDWLTNFSFNQKSYDVRILKSPPKKLKNLIYDDIFRAYLPKLKNVISNFVVFVFLGHCPL